MQNVIKELYYGNIHPFEKRFDKNSAYARVLTEAAKAEEKLLSSLGEEEKRLYGELRGVMSSVTGEESLKSFIEGFRLGARFMLDALISNESIFDSVTK